MPDDELIETETTVDPATTTDPEPEAQAPDEQVYTQKQLGEILAKERRKWKRTRSESATKTTDSDLADRMQRLELRETFADITADMQMPAQVRARLRQSFLAERPDDPSEWIAGWSSVLHRPEPEQTKQPETEPAPAQAPAKPFGTSKPAAPSEPQLDDPSTWDRGYVDEIVRAAKTRAEGYAEVRRRMQAAREGKMLVFGGKG